MCALFFFSFLGKTIKIHHMTFTFAIYLRAYIHARITYLYIIYLSIYIIYYIQMTDNSIPETPFVISYV